MQIVQYFVALKATIKDLKKVTTYLNEEKQRERTTAILRLIELGIPAKDLRVCIDFLKQESEEGQVNLIEQLINVGVVPEQIKHACKILAIGVTSKWFMNAVSLVQAGVKPQAVVRVNEYAGFDLLLQLVNEGVNPTTINYKRFEKVTKIGMTAQQIASDLLKRYVSKKGIQT